MLRKCGGARLSDDSGPFARESSAIRKRNGVTELAARHSLSIGAMQNHRSGQFAFPLPTAIVLLAVYACGSSDSTSQTSSSGRTPLRGETSGDRTCPIDPPQSKADCTLPDGYACRYAETQVQGQPDAVYSCHCGYPSWTCTEVVCPVEPHENEPCDSAFTTRACASVLREDAGGVTENIPLTCSCRAETTPYGAKGTWDCG